MGTINIENADKIIPAMRRGIASAINKTMAKAQTAASKQVRTVYNIKARDLKSKVKFQKANINKSVAGFSIRGRRLTVARFATGQNEIGVQVKIKKTSGRKTIKSAFLAVGRGSRLQVFKRVGKSRLPVRVVKTVGPVKMYEKEGEKAVEKAIVENFHNLMQHEIEFKLSRL